MNSTTIPRHLAYITTNHPCEYCDGHIVEEIERIAEHPVQVKSNGHYCDSCGREAIDDLLAKTTPENIPTNIDFQPYCTARPTS